MLHVQREGCDVDPAWTLVYLGVPRQLPIASGACSAHLGAVASEDGVTLMMLLDLSVDLILSLASCRPLDGIRRLCVWDQVAFVTAITGASTDTAFSSSILRQRTNYHIFLLTITCILSSPHNRPRGQQE